MSHSILGTTAAAMGTFGLTLLSLPDTLGPLPADGPAADAAEVRPAAAVQLRLNIPAYRLDVYESGERVRSYAWPLDLPAIPLPCASSPSHA